MPLVYLLSIVTTLDCLFLAHYLYKIMCCFCFCSMVWFSSHLSVVNLKYSGSLWLFRAAQRFVGGCCFKISMDNSVFSCICPSPSLSLSSLMSLVKSPPPTPLLVSSHTTDLFVGGFYEVSGPSEGCHPWMSVNSWMGKMELQLQTRLPPCFSCWMGP